MPVFSADELSKKTLFLVFERKNDQIKDEVIKSLNQCQGQMGMKSSKIETLLLPDVRGNWPKMQQAVEDFLSKMK